MEQKDYIRHLISPQLGYNSGSDYVDRIVGMHLEVMLLDSHLNQDMHEYVDRHVNLTQHLHDKHQHKLSI